MLKGPRPLDPRPYATLAPVSNGTAPSPYDYYYESAATSADYATTDGYARPRLQDQPYERPSRVDPYESPSAYALATPSPYATPATDPAYTSGPAFYALGTADGTSPYAAAPYENPYVAPAYAATTTPYTATALYATAPGFYSVGAALPGTAAADSTGAGPVYSHATESDAQYAVPAAVDGYSLGGDSAGYHRVGTDGGRAGQLYGTSFYSLGANDGMVPAVDWET